MNENHDNNGEGPSACKKLSKMKECTPPAQKCPPCGAKQSISEQKMDEIFANNVMLVSGLLHFIRLEERKKVEKWLKKLYTLNSNRADRITRDDYLWFLLVQLENGTVTVPFVKDPPEGKLKPVPCSVPDKQIYQEILQAANNRSEFDDLSAPITNKLPHEFYREADPCGSKIEKKLCKKCKPADFLEKQPKPVCGFIAYGSCFSSQD